MARSAPTGSLRCWEDLVGVHDIERAHVELAEVAYHQLQGVESVGAGGTCRLLDHVGR